MLRVMPGLGADAANQRLSENAAALAGQLRADEAEVAGLRREGRRLRSIVQQRRTPGSGGAPEVRPPPPARVGSPRLVPPKPASDGRERHICGCWGRQSPSRLRSAGKLVAYPSWSASRQWQQRAAAPSASFLPPDRSHNASQLQARRALCRGGTTGASIWRHLTGRCALMRLSASIISHVSPMASAA